MHHRKWALFTSFSLRPFDLSSALNCPRAPLRSALGQLNALDRSNGLNIKLGKIKPYFTVMQYIVMTLAFCASGALPNELLLDIEHLFGLKDSS